MPKKDLVKTDYFNWQSPYNGQMYPYMNARVNVPFDVNDQLGGQVGLAASAKSQKEYIDPEKLKFDAEMQYKYNKALEFMMGGEHRPGARPDQNRNAITAGFNYKF